MMSPLSVATFIPPNSVEFDLVVFDEASQVKPVDAFGAIVRGKQTVVVGDSRQLPPTDFFAALVMDGDGAAGDMESILDLFSAKNAPERMLRWHYRSRHESLIAVSNMEFYDNRLQLFPSPDAAKEEVGLIYHHLSDTTYDRGGSRSNLKEAQIVAKKIMEHAKSRPNLTLGVATFSIAQRQAVQDQLELLRRQDSSCEETFFNAHPEEPFFVKNLENVQGDERDIIFISIGYGRDANGELTMNFGPLNKDGGERRLNVLITRARRRCEVFTNLTADDIDLSRTNARGIVALKRYLKYAQTGKAEIARPSNRESDSPFEDAVADALRGCGYEVDHQIGSSGYFIDLGIKDPERPGRYLLGIECDGATYHSAQSARDRDRIRQQVLEDLGWRIHRIWSTDWFRNPDRELKKAAEAIEAAKAHAGSPPVAIHENNIKYAQTGKAEIARPSNRESDSPFEDAVADALRGCGYEVDHQIGSSGYFIDLGIKDPERPGRYLLGIECDGATYHSAQSARDRDRIRQQVLEDLGWRIHRIWSTDWFRNPDRELKKAAEAIEAAKAHIGSPPVAIHENNVSDSGEGDD